MASLFDRYKGYSGSRATGVGWPGSLFTSSAGMAEAATSRAEDKKTKKEEGRFTISAKLAGEMFVIDARLL